MVGAHRWVAPPHPHESLLDNDDEYSAIGVLINRDRVLGHRALALEGQGFTTFRELESIDMQLRHLCDDVNNNEGEIKKVRKTVETVERQLPKEIERLTDRLDRKVEPRIARLERTLAESKAETDARLRELEKAQMPVPSLEEGPVGGSAESGTEAMLVDPLFPKIVAQVEENVTSRIHAIELRIQALAEETTLRQEQLLIMAGLTVKKGESGVGEVGWEHPFKRWIRAEREETDRKIDQLGEEMRSQFQSVQTAITQGHLRRSAGTLPHTSSPSSARSPRRPTSPTKIYGPSPSPPRPSAGARMPEYEEREFVDLGVGRTPLHPPYRTDAESSKPPSVSNPFHFGLHHGETTPLATPRPQHALSTGVGISGGLFGEVNLASKSVTTAGLFAKPLPTAKLGSSGGLFGATSTGRGMFDREDGGGPKAEANVPRFAFPTDVPTPGRFMSAPNPGGLTSTWTGMRPRLLAPFTYPPPQPSRTPSTPSRSSTTAPPLVQSIPPPSGSAAPRSRTQSNAPRTTPPRAPLSLGHSKSAGSAPSGFSLSSEKLGSILSLGAKRGISAKLPAIPSHRGKSMQPPSSVDVVTAVSVPPSASVQGRAPPESRRSLTMPPASSSDNPDPTEQAPGASGSVSIPTSAVGTSPVVNNPLSYPALLPSLSALGSKGKTKGLSVSEVAAWGSHVSGRIRQPLPSTPGTETDDRDEAPLGSPSTPFSQLTTLSTLEASTGLGASVPGGQAGPSDRVIVKTVTAPKHQAGKKGKKMKGTKRK